MASGSDEVFSQKATNEQAEKPVRAASVATSKMVSGEKQATGVAGRALICGDFARDH